jgi:hypothetical protein
MKRFINLIPVFFIYSFLNAQDKFPEFPPNDVDFKMDRDQMLYQLGITFPELPAKTEDPKRPLNAWPADSTNPQGNWQDAQGRFVARSSFGLWTNYDEDSAGVYTPIDLLKMNDGTTIKTEKEWWEKRRPEVKQAVENEIWGVIPPKEILPTVTFSTEVTSGGQGFNTYLQKEITGTIDIRRYWKVRNQPVIKAVLRTPAAATGPVPVMVIFGGFGNVLERYWEITRDHGWGVCIFSPNDLQPDNGTGLTSYLIGLVNKGNWRTPEQWGSLGAWSWGISRLIDYFETDKHVDAKKIGLSGHSRYGKATLVTMAYEPRLAIAYPSCGGALGPSMIRRHWAQDLENIAWEREYHWVAGNFFKYMGPLNEGEYLPRKVENLTVDAHSLLALCAPRPVFLNGGTQDSWTDFYGTYLSAKGASPVYQLLGKKGVVMNDGTPKEDVAYLEGDIGYRYHVGGHTDLPDWPSFFEFASKYFTGPVLVPQNSFINLAAKDDTTAMLKVKSNGSWQIFRSEGWIELEKTTSGESDSLLISVKNHNGLFARKAKLTLRGHDIERSIQVNQASPQPALTIAGANLQIAEKGDPFISFEIKSNTAWHISSDQNWIYPEEESGINTAIAVLTADDNPTVETREAQITVKGVGTEPKPFTVYQRAGAPTLDCNTTSLSLGAASGSTNGFWASSNTTWQVEVTEDWLIINNPAGGNGFSRINVTAKENNGSERTARLLIKIKNLPDHVVEITQAGAGN